MRTYKCPACFKEHKTKTRSLCHDCYALIEPDGNKRAVNLEKERRIPVYRERAALEKPLFS